MLGNGDGSFQACNEINIGNLPFTLALGDFNNDGNLDIITGNFTTSSVSVILGNGDGTFQNHLDRSISSQAEDLILGDFNNDGNLDVITTTHASNPNSLLWERGWHLPIGYESRR